MAEPGAILAPAKGGAVAQELRCEQDDVATRLTCTACDVPICPQCFVRTPVGFKCRTCVGAGAAIGRGRTPNRTTFIAVAVAGVLALVGWRLLGSGDEGLVDESARYSGQSARDIERFFLGEAGSEGPLTFTATGFDCGVAGLAGAVRGRVPQGRFCSLRLTVQNTGTQPETFLAAEQVLLDPQARRYRPDDDPDLASRVVNPGNELTATLLFDVPPSVNPDEAELHRSQRSRGVRVLLRPR